MLSLASFKALNVFLVPFKVLVFINASWRFIAIWQDKGTMIHKLKFLFCSQVRMSTSQGTHPEHVDLTGFVMIGGGARTQKNLLALKNSCA